MQQKQFYKDICVGELLTRLAKNYPEQEGLIYPDLALRYTFRGMEEISRKVAKGLLKLGINKGDRVALWATNVPEWVILQFALAKIGAILVTVNVSFRARELEYLLGQSESVALICIPQFKDLNYINTVYEIIPELKDGTNSLPTKKLPFFQKAILIGEEKAEGFINFQELFDLGKDISDEVLDRRESTLEVDDVINMQYTSGTTGFPKGVMLSHRNIVNNGYWLGEAMRYTEKDRLCLPVPLFHCFGCVIGVLGIYTHAGSLVPLEIFDPHKVLEYVEKERCTALYGVPTMFIAELEDSEFSQFDLRSLRTGTMAGALCPEPLMRRVIKDMHLTDMIIAYGLTEASPGITHTLIDDTIANRTQTVGKVMAEQEIRIIDPVTKEILPANCPGELCVKGYNVMKGYYNNEQATKEAMVNLEGLDGWLRTGDQATIDNNGYVRITGRIKDIIIRGGENISPKEIEDLIRLHPRVSDVYIYGVSSEKYGEEVAAAIKVKVGEELSSEEVIEFCQGKISKFKIPQYIKFVKEFPTTASGKVQKFKLRELHFQ
ncbi:MAG: AMP-binding protein [Acidobacteria bacterium]|nr:AMP-binding protein [Acidobacteriota bacterium]